MIAIEKPPGCLLNLQIWQISLSLSVHARLCVSASLSLCARTSVCMSACLHFVCVHTSSRACWLLNVKKAQPSKKEKLDNFWVIVMGYKLYNPNK